MEDSELFLNKHPFLRRFLPTVEAKAREYFGADTRLVLEVFTDPEAEELCQQLVVLIESAHPTQEAWRRYDEFCERWWLDALPQAQNKLIIDLS